MTDEPAGLSARPAWALGGIALTTLAILADEVITARVLSVVTWYHLAFFVVSLAMLGMTVAALSVYLRPRRFAGERGARAIVDHAAWFGASLAASHLGLLLLRVPTDLGLDAMSLATLVATSLLCALPFYYSGVVVVLCLARVELPIGRLYGADLVGAGAGCLAALGLMTWLDPTSALFLLGAAGVGAAWCFARAFGLAPRRLDVATGFALLAAAALNGAFYPDLLRVDHAKGRAVGRGLLLDRWNSHSRVTARPPVESEPQYWGAGRGAPAPPVRQVPIRIDAGAFTSATGFDGDAGKLSWLRYDVTSAAYGVRTPRDVLVIGSGGGRDLLTALAAGAERVVGVEINGLILDLLRGPLGEFARLAGDPRVTLVHADGRNYLATRAEEYDLVQMSLVDTSASTAAGAMTLTENGLYTIEAWRLFLDRLRPEGMVSVSRWYAAGRASELGRLVAMAVAALLEDGSERPRQHLLVATAGDLGTLVVGRRPFDDAAIGAFRAAAEEHGFDILVAPGTPIGDRTLARIAGSRSLDELAAATRDPVLELEPATDDRPFFFNMLRPRAWLGRSAEVEFAGPGVIGGNKRAAATLLAVLAATGLCVVAGIVVPLALTGVPSGPAARHFTASSVYFSLIGLGFMLMEIGLMQRFSVLLGHPAYSLAVTLTGVIAAAGLGSFLSGSIPARAVGRRSLPLAALAAALLAFVATIQPLTDAALAWPLVVRAALVLAVCLPLGLLAGCAFPLGVRALGDPAEKSPAMIAWMWGLNGAFGVFGSVLAILVSMAWGISRCFLVAALLYAAAAAALTRLRA